MFLKQEFFFFFFIIWDVRASLHAPRLISGFTEHSASLVDRQNTIKMTDILAEVWTQNIEVENSAKITGHKPRCNKSLSSLPCMEHVLLWLLASSLALIIMLAFQNNRNMANADEQSFKIWGGKGRMRENIFRVRLSI